MQSIEEKIMFRQLDLLAKQQRVTTIGTTLLAIGIYVVFSFDASRFHLSLWLLAFFLLAAVRLLELYFYNRREHELNRKSYRHWLIVFSVTLFFAGCLWGAGSIIYFTPEKQTLFFFLSCMFLGLVSSASVSLSAILLPYLFFIVPAISPIIFLALTAEEFLAKAIGISIILYTSAQFMIAVNTNRSIVRTFRLECENEELIEQLRLEKASSDENHRVAAKAVQEKNQFLAAASHDLRQPLHAAGLSLNLLKDHVQDSSGQLLLNNIIDSNKSLNQIFSGLLDISRLDANVVVPAKKTFHLDQLIQRIAEQFLPIAEHKGININVECDSITAFSDPVLLDRILQNLITNAISYTNAGVVTIRCRQTNDKHLEIEVHDTGCGIAEIEQEHIFSEFYQINNHARDKTKGFGLGLAIVKRLCDLLKIAIKLDSKQDEYTRFRLTIPKGDAATPDYYSRSSKTISLAEKTVLLIDDEETIRKATKSTLDDWGCVAIVAESIEHAINLLQETDAIPDIIISDYRLANNETGVQAVEAIFEELNTMLPAIIITGDTSPDRIKEATEGGFELLHKPVDPERLKALIYQSIANDTYNTHGNN